jgi:hypothetical protein
MVVVALSLSAFIFLQARSVFYFSMYTFSPSLKTRVTYCVLESKTSSLKPHSDTHSLSLSLSHRLRDLFPPTGDPSVHGSPESPHNKNNHYCKTLCTAIRRGPSCHFCLLGCHFRPTLFSLSSLACMHQSKIPTKPEDQRKTRARVCESGNLSLHEATDPPPHPLPSCTTPVLNRISPGAGLYLT